MWYVANWPQEGASEPHLLKVYFVKHVLTGQLTNVQVQVSLPEACTDDPYAK